MADFVVSYEISEGLLAGENFPALDGLDVADIPVSLSPAPASTDGSNGYAVVKSCWLNGRLDDATDLVEFFENYLDILPYIDETSILLAGIFTDDLHMICIYLSRLSVGQLKLEWRLRTYNLDHHIVSEVDIVQNGQVYGYANSCSILRLLIGKTTYNGDNYFMMGFTALHPESPWGLGDVFLPCIAEDYIESILKAVPEGDKTSPEFGKVGKRKGGYNKNHHRKGTFDDSSDKIVVSDKPGTSPFSTGFINGYTVTRTQLAGFSRALFPPQPTSFTDIPGAIMGLITTMVNNKKPDYILDFLIVPVTPNTGNEEVISLGGSYLQYADDQGLVHFVHGNPININSCYVDHQCGSITIPEYWANFLDFSGSRFKLFLPYVGYVDIQPEYINGGNLKVWYRFNVFDGSFMCYVESTSGHSELDESLIAQYAGVAAVHIPVQARDYSNKISGLISAMGVVAAGATGGVTAAAGMGAAASLGNTMVQKPGSTHANGYNASSSFLSHRKPYLIIERQSSQFSEKYPEEKGLPLFIKTTIGQCRGLTVCDQPHLDTIPATVEEKERIYKYLTEGIIV